MIFRIAFALFFTLTTIANADDRRIDKDRLVVMTINTYFMWDGRAPEDGSSQIDAAIPWKNSPTEADEHMEAIAEVIARHNPDIINLVEVENEAAVAHLNSEFLDGRGYNVFFAQGGDTFTGQDVALLTKIDPVDGQIHFDDQFGESGNTRKRLTKQYRARIDVGDLKLLIVGVHYLSRPDDRSRRWDRQAQADATRQIVRAHRCADCEAVVLGDFNDYDGETGFRDHIDSTPISSVLPILKKMQQNDSSDNLINLSGDIPKGLRYTAFWDQDEDGIVDRPHELTSIDHILVSPNLHAKLDSVSVDHDMREVIGSADFVSDHYPIVAFFDLSDGAGASTQTINLTSILPNPAGNENQNELAEITNEGSSEVSLDGWRLVDRGGSHWELSGTIAPDSSITIRRDGQRMAMTNTGDTIELRDSDNRLIDSITYSSAVEGQFVFSN